MEIIKSSGERVVFNLAKIRESIVRAGGSGTEAVRIANAVEHKITNGMSTRDVYHLVRRELEGANKCVSCRYSLRDALTKLGPAGFVFEKYVAKVLEAQGYVTDLPDEFEGACVRHEIDVVAEKNGRRMAIEVKFRNDANDHVRLKDVLVHYARYLDLVDGGALGKCPLFNEAWLVTNGVFSDRAMKYAACKGVHLLGWNYPRGASFATFIDNTGLYPVTVLPTLTNAELLAFGATDLMLCKSVAKMEAEELARRIDVPTLRAAALIRDAIEIVK